MGNRVVLTLSRRRFLHASTAALASALQVSTRISTTDLGGATLLQGAGCNVVAMRGTDPNERRQGVPADQGALMIDGGRAANAEALVAAVKSATDSRRIHTLINTHWH